MFFFYFLFHRIFTEYTELKKLWKFSEGLNTLDEIRNNNKVRAHGEKLFRTIDKILHNLTNIDNLIMILTNLGD
jgi:hypothetical protein